jgi:hypothetical protein
VLSVPPDQVSWFDLHTIARTDPDRAAARWEEIKRAALDELQTGHRAARAIETVNNDAWQRAQFLALREELSADWRPRNGIEHQLIDTMAQAQAGCLSWLRTLTMRTDLESRTNDRRHRGATGQTEVAVSRSRAPVQPRLPGGRWCPVVGGHFHTATADTGVRYPRMDQKGRPR